MRNTAQRTDESAALGRENARVAGEGVALAVVSAVLSALTASRLVAEGAAATPAAAPTLIAGKTYGKLFRTGSDSIKARR